MYSAIEENGSVVLQSDSSTLEIWPSCGAILNRWVATLHQQPRSMIEGYDSPRDFATHSEANGFRSCKLSPYACRIPDGIYQIGDRSYRIGKYQLNGASIHGLLYNEPFDLLSLESGEHHAMAMLQHDYEATDPGYPFRYRLQLTYFLGRDNRLTISSTVLNRHRHAIPMADGWHPYFTLGLPVDELFLEIASDIMLEFDDRLVPTGNLLTDHRFEQPASLEDVSLDNCFLLHHPLDGPACRLINPRDGIALHLYADNNYPYLQVYTPPHRRSIALENLSAAPDAFNNHMGIIWVDPGESINFTATWQATVLA